MQQVGPNDNFIICICCMTAKTSIGANSLGSLIFPGIALNNQPQLLLGAACTALLALVLDAAVSFSSKRWLERGLVE